MNTTSTRVSSRSHSFMEQVTSIGTLIQRQMQSKWENLLTEYNINAVLFDSGMEELGTESTNSVQLKVLLLELIQQPVIHTVDNGMLIIKLGSVLKEHKSTFMLVNLITTKDRVLAKKECLTFLATLANSLTANR